jgi:hypothetical protein
VSDTETLIIEAGLPLKEIKKAGNGNSVSSGISIGYIECLNNLYDFIMEIE